MLMHQLHSVVGIEMTKDNGIDPWGPWFDGVNLLQDKEIGIVDVGVAKSKEIVIVGAGMSGLMSYLVLTQAGFTNITIVEASQRVGGRVYTEYLTGGPFDYSYQEMGAMRFPLTYTNPKTNETVKIRDHELVFSLAEEMNRLNNHDKSLFVEFKTWVQKNQNGLVYKNGFKLPSGLPPTVAEVEANASLSATAPLDPSTQQLQATVDAILDPDFLEKMAENMFVAHRDWLGKFAQTIAHLLGRSCIMAADATLVIVNGLHGLGGDVWSEFAYMVNYLHASLNDTDVVIGNSAPGASFWDNVSAIDTLSL